LIALALFLALISVGVGMVFLHLFRVLSTPRDLSEALNLVAEFSSERYRPMDSGDLSLPKSHPGSSAQLREAHIRAFHSYVRCIENDFQAVCWAIKALTVQSKIDRPDLVRMLLRSQIAFAFCVAKIQVRVVLYRHGIGTVNVAALLKQFDGLRLELVAMSSVT
jgi:hypothetical protein